MINARRIEMAAFMSHEQSTVEIPERGLVVVTGPNGAGKSSLVEAISVALWNRTLRGTQPWAAVEGGTRPGEVTVETDDVRSTRKRSKTRSELSWALLEGDTPEYENTTKAQRALERRVGEWNTWRRCSVFSSQDASHFTLATDAERKRLLEAILDLTQFDEALGACRKDLSEATTKADEARRGIEVEQARLDAARSRLDDAEQQLGLAPPEVDLDALRDRLRSLRAMISETDAEAAELRTRIRKAETRLAEARAAVKSAERDASRLDRDACPTCGQPIPAKLRDELRTAVEQASALVDEREAAAREARDEAEAVLVELHEDREGLQQQATRADVQGRSAAAATKAREAAAAAKASAAEARAKSEAKIAELERQLAEADALVAELTAVEHVLGLRGVRAHVLGNALGGIEHVANAWLGRIAGEGMRLHLRAYSEKKTGGVTDAISLDIEGAGGGHGYKASSGGERRRIDVALLMALAEVARGARGVGAGSIFFDEVFDALDTEGVAAVSAALDELSRDRAVVVISHSQNLVGQLRPALRLHIDGGVVTAQR